jgi:hypothetical protein
MPSSPLSPPILSVLALPILLFEDFNQSSFNSAYFAFAILEPRLLTVFGSDMFKSSGPAFSPPSLSLLLSYQ